jgi:hypothetical protein
MVYTYNTHGRNVHIRFWYESLRGRENMDDLHICVRIILKWILKKYSAHDRNM